MYNRPIYQKLIESAVGAHLLNQSLQSRFEVLYWRERNKEVDFVLQQAEKLLAIEVKSGYKKFELPGIADFIKDFSAAKAWLVGGDGIKLENFFSTEITW